MYSAMPIPCIIHGKHYNHKVKLNQITTVTLLFIKIFDISANKLRIQT